MGDEVKDEKKVKEELSDIEKKMYKILPKEEDEDTNPRIKLYNDIVRHAMVYDTNYFSTGGIVGDELLMIFMYALDDYPEIFWTDGYYTSGANIKINYRCVDENGVLDIKQIERKRAEIKKHARFFTRGITRRTKPYDALLTIYRRLILTLDYDGIGLDAHIDRDTRTDDKLRSLHSAIVEHKVVCAGYAVAMQYLLQSVGISSACVTSEVAPNGKSCHAFNALKIGKYCYYLDATWGDWSNTNTGENYKDIIGYDYCCVPLKELQMTSPGNKCFHTPRGKYYPHLEEFTATNHEYFRFHKAYLTRYDEEQIVNAIANYAMTYDKKEMGDFRIGFRCTSVDLANYILSKMGANQNMFRLIEKAREIVKRKKRSAAKFLDVKSYVSWSANGAPVFYVGLKY